MKTCVQMFHDTQVNITQQNLVKLVIKYFETLCVLYVTFRAMDERYLIESE